MHIHYLLRLSNPASHYLEVEIYLNHIAADQLEIALEMPVWTPGSYLVREYARHIESFGVCDATGKALKWRKTNKHTWQIWTEGASAICARYHVYAYEMSVRTNFVSHAWGYVNGAATFMYVREARYAPTQLGIVLPLAWEGIHTSLPPCHRENTAIQLDEAARWFEAADFDTLIDSPIALGKPTAEAHFRAAGDIPHWVVLYGLEEVNIPSLTNDLQRVVEASTSIFGTNPCDRYLFMAHFTAHGYGGLEHCHSTSLLFSRDEYAQPKGYAKFLTLCAHEYFHLWNVKRLRPAEFYHLDLSQENYTTLLWQVEGFTTYYEQIITLKAGIQSPKQFVREMAARISHVESQPGRYIQSLTEASWDTWIKYYRPNENSPNSTISYYTQGAVMAMLLDLLIIKGSEAKYTLDEAMRRLYAQCYEQGQGFCTQDVLAILSELAHTDLQDFYQQYINGTAVPDYAYYLDIVGLELELRQEQGLVLGIHLDGQRISYVRRGSAAEIAGLQVNDRIIAAAGKSLKDASEWLKHCKANEAILLTVERDGFLLPIHITPQENPVQRYSLKKKNILLPAQRKALRVWLRKV